MIAQSASTPRQIPMVSTPPDRPVTPPPAVVDLVDPTDLNTTRDRVIKLAKATFDQVTEKSGEITADYAKIVDEALRLVLFIFMN